MEVIYLKMLRLQKINGHLLVGIHLETDALTSCENITEKKFVEVLVNTVIVAKFVFPCACSFFFYYCPPTKLREGNVFSGVCVCVCADKGCMYRALVHLLYRVSTLAPLYWPLPWGPVPLQPHCTVTPIPDMFKFVHDEA